MTATTSPLTRTITEHAQLMRGVALAAVGTAMFLVTLKAVAFILTDSMAMMASLADSALDVFASFINLLAVRAALTPADHEHRFGHGKAEPLAGLAQSAFIAGSSAFLVIESISRMIEPRPIEHSAIGLLVMAVSIAATVVLVTAQQVVVRRTGSIAIGADRMHYLSDIVVNVGVVIGLLLASNFHILIADPIVGLVVAAILALGVWRVFEQSYDQLMDRELPDADRERIKQIIMQHPAVQDLHDLRTRAAGVGAFIQVHIELNPTLSLMSAHAVADEVEASLNKVFPNAEVIIHQDPEGFEAVGGLAKS